MFYERYVSLCKQNSVSPSGAATQAGFNKGTVSVWKKKYTEGFDVRPEKDVVEKICNFFGCSESWLLGIDEQQKTPTPENGSERDYSDSVLLDAFMQADESTQEAIRLLLKLK